MKLEVQIVVEMERETDGRWIAEVRCLKSGLMAYGSAAEDALGTVLAFAGTALMNTEAQVLDIVDAVRSGAIATRVPPEPTEPGGA